VAQWGISVKKTGVASAQQKPQGGYIKIFLRGVSARICWRGRKYERKSDRKREERPGAVEASPGKIKWKIVTRTSKVSRDERVATW